MKLASRVILVTLAIGVFCLSAFAQGTTDPSRMSDKDPRNTAPTVGTGGPTGGPTGLFTVYDGKTLRKGEHTVSIAYSNYDRDPGNMDFTEIPASFQIGLSNNFEVFYNTDIYRGVKVNSIRNISGPYLQDSGFGFPAIVLGPPGPAGQAVFRPANTTFAAGTPTAGSGNGSFFPGGGSAAGGILPGIVLQTVPVFGFPGSVSRPTVFTVVPSYNPEAPLIDKRFGESYFNTMIGGFKWRWTNPDAAVGVGIIGAYRWFNDRFPSREAELRDGASQGGNRGDILGTFFLDARVGEHVNVSANVGYHLNSNIKGNVGGFNAILLNRPDELLFSAGVDFPINRFFQPIVEARYLRYVRSRTENAFENHPFDLLGGFRIFPKRWLGFSFAYRRHMNQQDEDSFDNTNFDGSATVTCTPPVTGCQNFQVGNTFTGVPPGFLLSENPHGWIAQFFIGRRNPRLVDIENKFANVTNLTVSDTTITGGCPAGFVPAPGAVCNDSTMVTVTTTAVDPENDVLTYNYTVSGGRIVGTGANVQWDLSGLQPGTYTITAGVDDGCGLCGQTQTRTVTVENCNCVRACSCPSLSVSGPAGVTTPGDTMTFTANVSGGPDVTYNWTVSGGTITSGQGTPSIVVGTTTADAGTTITATVTLGGLDPACNCPETASESGPVDSRPIPVLVDEFGALPNDDIRGRLDIFFQELSNNPNNQGYIINYGTDRQIAARERLITNHITLRGFDRSRITLVRGGDTGAGVNTKLYRIPPGAENPNP